MRFGLCFTHMSIHFFYLFFLFLIVLFIQRLLPTKVLTNNGLSDLFITLLLSWQKFSAHPTPLKLSTSYPTMPTSTHQPIQFMKVVPWGEFCYSTMLAIQVVKVISTEFEWCWWVCCRTKSGTSQVFASKFSIAEGQF